MISRSARPRQSRPTHTRASPSRQFYRLRLPGKFRSRDDHIKLSPSDSVSWLRPDLTVDVNISHETKRARHNCSAGQL